MTDTQAKTMINCLRTLINKVDELAAQLKPADRFIDVKEIYEITNMKKSTVYERVNRGEIPAYKVNGKMQMSFNKLQEILPTLR